MKKKIKRMTDHQLIQKWIEYKRRNGDLSYPDYCPCDINDVEHVIYWIRRWKRFL
jgi:hypothetical protein